MLQRSLLAALAVALLAAPSAGAAARTRSAQAFADAALRAERAVRAQAPAIDRQITALRPARCSRIVRELHLRRRDRAERALNFTLFGLLRPLIDVLIPIQRQLVADLDAVPTRDPALIAGREAWRDLTRLFEGYPLVERPCDRLREWRGSGYRPDLAPPSFVALMAELEEWEASDTFSDGVGGAERRLRMLGVSRVAAARFSEDLIDVYDYGPHLGGEDGNEPR